MSLQENRVEQLCGPHEFLRVCLCPYLHQLFTVVDGIPQFSVTATAILTLLAVAVESLEGCDWLAVSRCEPVPLVLCVCRLVHVSRRSDDSCRGVRERAVVVLNKLVQLLGKHADGVSCKLFDCS